MTAALKRFELAALVFVALAALASGRAEAQCVWSVFENGTTADANAVNDKFNCVAQLSGANFTGNVGINEPSPVAPLDVAGDIHISGTTSPAVTAQGAYLSWNSLYGYLGETDFINNQGGGAGGFAFMNTPQSGSPLTTLMFISGSGLVGIGTTAPVYPLDVNGIIRSNNAFFATGAYGGFQLADRVASNPGYSFLYRANDITNLWDSVAGNVLSYNTSGYVGIGTTSPGSYMLYINGSAGGLYGWNVVSDARLKQHVANLRDGLALIEQLRPVRFDWLPGDKRAVGKELALPVDKPQVGFIAQEVEKVIPEAVNTPAKGSTEPYSLRATDLIPILVEAVKEQQAEIADLRATVVDLKTQLGTLKPH